MIVRLNIALRNAILDNIFNAGAGLSIFDSGTAEFRTGAQPATGDDAATGTIVATVNLPADAMAAASGGSIAKSASAWQDLSADNAGTIGWVRLKSADGTKTMDLDCSDNGGSGAVKIDNPTLVAAQQFSVTSFSLTMPGTT
jgi:hypothetical protein